MAQIYPVRAFNDNYIWIIHNQHDAVVVDPGDALPVLSYLRHNDLQLIAILNTHHHHDHVGGNAALLEKFSVPIYGPANETIPTRTHPIKEGDNVQLDKLSLNFSVLEIPGHTSGHIAYFGSIDEANVLFCGDTLFACGCGRLFEGTAAQMYTSLQKLAVLPDATLVYSAHEYTLANIKFARTVEPNNIILEKLEVKMQDLRRQDLPTLPSTIATEKATNPFLRCDQAEIIAHASHHADKPLSSPNEVFAEIRAWKNTF